MWLDCQERTTAAALYLSQRLSPIQSSGSYGSSSAPVELTLDLRGTPPDRVVARLFGALERVSDDVTLIALVRDTPEFASALSAAYGALRQRGYWSDSSRFPAGVQRLKIGRRQASGAHRPEENVPRLAEPAYAPAPEADAHGTEPGR